MNCSICKVETSQNNLRFGVCWDCATAESIIAEGLDMDDKSLTGKPASSPREKVSLLLARGWRHSGLTPRTPDEKPAGASFMSRLLAAFSQVTQTVRWLLCKQTRI